MSTDQERGEHTEATLDGWWDVHGQVVVIDGTELDWKDGGEKTLVQRPSPMEICMYWQGVSCIGVLSPSGTLEWSDGDVWMRHNIDGFTDVWRQTASALPNPIAESSNGSSTKCVQHEDETYLGELNMKLSRIVANKASYLQRNFLENISVPSALPGKQKQAWCKTIQRMLEEDLLKLVWAEWSPIECSKGVQLWDGSPHRKKKGCVFTSPSSLLKKWQQEVCGTLVKLDSPVRFVTVNGRLCVEKFGANTIIDFVKQISRLNVWSHKGQQYVFPNLVHKLLNEYESAEIEYSYKAAFAQESLHKEHRDLGFGTQARHCARCDKLRTVGRTDLLDSCSWTCLSCFQEFYGMWAWYEDSLEKIREMVKKHYQEEKHMCSNCSEERHYGQYDPFDPGDAKVADWYCLQCFIEIYGWFPWTDQGRKILKSKGPPISRALRSMQKEPRLSKHQQKEAKRVAITNSSIMTTLSAAAQPKRLPPASATSSVWEAGSAPASCAPRQCLLPSTLVLMANGKGVIKCSSASDLVAGAHVRAGVGVTIVEHLEAHPARERDVVRMTFRENTSGSQGSLTVTTSQSLPIRRPSSKQFLPLPASDLRRGDILRTHLGEAIIIDILSCVIESSAIEVNLESKCSTMLVGDPSADSFAVQMFAEVYGELAPPPADQFVKILRFRRSSYFKQALLDGEALRACREDLESHGFFADLSLYQLGPGKMFVSPNLASRTLDVLRQRNTFLQAREVVVDRSFESAVLDAALHVPGARPNHLMGDEPLDLRRSIMLWITTEPVRCSDENVIVVERTFLRLPPPVPPDARSVVTSSTTDAHAKKKNPRAISEQIWWD